MFNPVLILNVMRASRLFLLVFLGAPLFAACSGSGPATADPSRAAIDRFIQQLDDRGVTAIRQGTAGDAIAATIGTRLLLNNSDLVDVYHFQSAGEATFQADLADMSVRYDVYQRGGLVVVHVREGDPAISSALQTLLGFPQ